MPKRHLDTGELPAPKRHNIPQAGAEKPSFNFNFDLFIYDELVLVIFSHLSWVDLCTTQPTNRNWCRLATDNQLWKNLFLKEHGRPRLRGSKGFADSNSKKERGDTPHSVASNESINWKWLFRIGNNWRKGRCVTTRLPEILSTPRDITLAEGHCVPRSHVAVAGSLIFATSPQIADHPLVYVYRTNKLCATLDLGKASVPTHITCLNLDQSPSAATSLRLAVFLETGEFSVLSVNYESPGDFTRIAKYTPMTKSQRVTPIAHAVYHHPLLITLSQSFHLSIYHINGRRILLTQSLTSFTSFPPTSLVLSTPSPSTYKLVLAYAMPVYPAHWSVAATELTIASASRPSPCTVLSTRTTRACDIPFTWVDDDCMRAIQEQWGRKVGKVADTETDGKWVVLAPGDGSTASVLQLYRLYLPAHSASTVPRLTFVRSLHGHTGGVAALSLSDGRCVSLGVDGTLWVWDLENGWDVEMPRLPGDGRTPDLSQTESRSVMFDDRRIITTGTHGVEICRFDV